MSIVGRREPIERLEELVREIKEGNLKGWVFVHRLDSITQDSFGEPVTTPDVEACMDQVDSEDLRFIAQKLLKYADVSEPNLESWR